VEHPLRRTQGMFFFVYYKDYILRLSQTIIAQADRDDCIVHLVQVMDDIYSFVKEAEPMKKIESHRRIVALMAQQTTECAYFIRNYAMNKSFCMSASTLKWKESHGFFTGRGTSP
jgi:hypothetical protein